MEVAALRLLLQALMLLAAGGQHRHCAGEAGAASLRIVPNRLQLFEYDMITFECEGLEDVTGRIVLRKVREGVALCGAGGETWSGRCVIPHVLETDSGEYWCEAGGAHRSDPVTIDVTAGSVILESPVLPVMEGDSVTLSCRDKTTSSSLVADFYKDGTHRETAYYGELTLRNVSRSDEGLYSCSISGVGKSAESRLTVRGLPVSSSGPGHAAPLLLLCVTVPMIVLTLLLGTGLCLCGKHRESVCASSKTTRAQEGEPAEAVHSITAVTDAPSAGAEHEHEHAFYYTID